VVDEKYFGNGGLVLNPTTQYPDPARCPCKRGLGRTIPCN